ncbi:hypothetical protein HBP99_07660 [Listeria booriae]|uniref:RsbT co-antagonist protein RsbRD N-terminal domain-containing protein n=1 Tax=Listeria booriae TaxID=1552123 RepID=A0A7X1D734_9LIST|nr:hypothetical protein [Listeria booriae]MBC2175165.1 hypothetical protein [Listeria booriae]MBC2368507.1 hypothetical protein [Listeria booriae]
MVTSVLRYVEEHGTSIIAYWRDTYYVKTSEYQRRKQVPGFLEAKEQETLALFLKAHQQIQNGQIDYTIYEAIGEDRFDIQTPFSELVELPQTLCTAILEYLFEKIKSGDLMIPDETLFDYILLLREIETRLRDGLVTGYLKQDGAAEFGSF